MLQNGVQAQRLGQWALLAALVLPTSLQASEVYRWVDDRGLVHYSSVAPRDFAYERIDPGARARQPATLANPRSAAEDGQFGSGEELAATGQPEAGMPQSESEDDLDLTESQREQRAQLQAEAQSRRAQLEAERQEQCERARRHYDELTTHTRVRVVDDSGQERMLSDAELQERISAAQDAIVTNCN